MCPVEVTGPELGIPTYSPFMCWRFAAVPMFPALGIGSLRQASRARPNIDARLAAVSIATNQAHLPRTAVVPSSESVLVPTVAESPSLRAS
jgi:hypothetical protein